MTAVLDDLETGTPLVNVARATGLSREKIRLMAEAHGITPTDPRDQRHPDHVDLVRRVSAWVCDQIESGGMPPTVTDVYDEFDQYQHSAVQRAINDAELFPLLAAHEVPDKVEWPKDTILTALREAAAVADRNSPGVLLTGETYDTMVKDRTVVGPSRSLIIQRFGSWSAACTAAGVPHEKRVLRGTTSEDYWPWLRRYAEDQMLLNHSLSFGEYSRWAKNQYGAPSGSLLKARMFLQVPWNDVRNELIRDLLADHPDRWVRQTKVEAEALT